MSTHALPIRIAELTVQTTTPTITPNTKDVQNIVVMSLHEQHRVAPPTSTIASSMHIVASSSRKLRCKKLDTHVRNSARPYFRQWSLVDVVYRMLFRDKHRRNARQRRQYGRPRHARHHNNHTPTPPTRSMSQPPPVPSTQHVRLYA